MLVDCENVPVCKTIVDHIYTITVPKSIAEPTTTSIILAPIDSQSTLSVILPGEFDPPKLS